MSRARGELSASESGPAPNPESDSGRPGSGQEPGSEPQEPEGCTRALAPILWVGVSGPPNGVEHALSGRGVPLRHVPDTPQLEPAALTVAQVLCFGPGHSAEEVEAALAGLAGLAEPESTEPTSMDGEHSAPPVVLVLGASGALDDFQRLIDDDRLFHLSQGRLPDRDLVALLTAAADAATGRTGAPRRQSPRASLPLDRVLDADVLRGLALARSPGPLTDAAAAAVTGAVGAASAHCLLVDREHQALRPSGTGAESEVRHTPAVGLAGFVSRTAVALCLARVGEDPRFDPEVDNPGGAPDDRFLAVPVVTGRGEVVAVLTALRPADEPLFEPRDLAALETVAAHTAPYIAASLEPPTAHQEAPAAHQKDPAVHQEAPAAHQENPAARPTAPPTGTGTTDEHPEPRATEDRPRPQGPFRERALRELERPGGGTAPLLRAAVARRWRRIRYVPQTAAADCGAACLAMTLGWHGKTVPLDEVRKITGLGRQGLDAQTLIRAAEHFGLRGRGVQIEQPEDLALLEPGSILHWGFYHFVVFERARRDGAWILDPGSGRRFVRREELDRNLTGVALTFEPGPELETGGERRPLLRRYLRRVQHHHASLGPILLVSLLIQITSLAVPVLTGQVVDHVIPGGDQQLFWVLTAGAAAFSIFALAVNLIRARLLLALRTRLDAQLSSDFLEHLVRLPFSFFQQRSAGDLLMRLASNATIREILTSSVLSGALDGLMVVSYLVLLLAADLRLGLLAAGLAAIRVVILVAAVRPRQRLNAETLEAQAATQSYQVQLVAGIEALKACGAERRAVASWSRLFARELNTSLERGRLDALVNSALAALGLASPIAILLFGAARVMAGDLTLGSMLAIAALAAGFLAPLSTLVRNASQFQLLGSYLERLDDVLSTPAEKGGLEWPEPEELLGRVTLEEVSFRYGPLVPPALDSVSLDAAPGQLLAVAGASGSGKSTLAGVVAGLLEPESGRVLYDGRPLAELPRDWLRAQLAYVPQQSFLFGSSIRANIALQDPDLPLERIVEAAKLAEIDDEIRALPMGYETVLADGGTSLSGGQRQRIALARALVGRPRVLILDEATSALDAVTEQKVQQNLRRLEMTSIVAAHRLSTIRDADRILVLEKGRVVDSGTHDELVDRPGVYRRLARAQMDGERELRPRSEETAR